MRGLLVVLALAAGAGAVLAADPPAVLSVAEWTAQAEAIQRDRNILAVERVKLLRALADASVLEERGKVLDIRPAHGQVEIVACGLTDAREVARFRIEAAERAEAETWKKWDRLTWRVLARVNDGGHVWFENQVRCLADLGRTPNPGIDPPPNLPNAGDPKGYTAALTALARAEFWNKPERERSAAYEALCAKVWLVPAVVTEGVDDLVWREGFSDGVCHVRVEFLADLTIFERSTKRMWGYRRGPRSIYVPDPQLAAALDPGTRVEVAVQIHRRERFGCTMTVRRILPDAKKK